MTALVAFAGVLVGWAISSAYNFWSIRRGELERAVVAATIVRDELEALAAALQPAGGGAAARAWREYREPLVLYTPEAEWQSLAEIARRLEAASAPSASVTLEALAPEVETALATLRLRTAQLRAAHQAFILTPLIRYLRSKPWRPRR